MFIQNGFSDYISKPIDVRLLNACLNKFVRDKRPPEAIEAAKSLPQQTPKEHDAMMAALFLQDANRALVALEDIMERQDFEGEGASHLLKAYTINAHSAKTLLRNIGKIELGNTADILECAGRDANIEIIKGETPQFLARFRAIIEALTPEAAEDDGDAGVDEDLDFLRGQLEAIQASCEIYNKNVAEDVIDALNQKPQSKRTKQLLSEISLYLLRGQFDEAAELAKQAADDI